VLQVSKSWDQIYIITVSLLVADRFSHSYENSPSKCFASSPSNPTSPPRRTPLQWGKDPEYCFIYFLELIKTKKEQASIYSDFKPLIQVFKIMEDS
jgi:hypothetical protein